jgi:RNA polymerase sigma-70 factor (ECF subfamily)
MASAARAPALPERQLAVAFVGGDPDSVRAIFARYAGPIYTIAFSRLGRRQLAEEAVQETLIRAWQARASFDPDRRFGPWLYQIARRVATDIFRRERRHDAEPMPDTVPVDTEATLTGTWDAWQVREALSALSPQQRELIRLTHYVGLTQSQIAQRLEVPIGTVKSGVLRSHRRLAERLAHLREAR